jgi:hypothetical protein
MKRYIVSILFWFFVIVSILCAIPLYNDSGEWNRHNVLPGIGMILSVLGMAICYTKMKIYNINNRK